MTQEKAILTCALTGVLTNPQQHPVPVTPEQMAAQARQAFDAGASIMVGGEHIANWLKHGVVSREQVMETLGRMAAVVDRQNAGDPAYRPIGNDFAGSLAFQAAVELVLSGDRQPNGYTEPVLTAFRRRRKVEMAIR